jgi:hypothetical protein
MGKTVDPNVQTAIDSKKFSGVLLARLHFSTPQRFCNADQTIYWDENGGGDVAYVGVGKYANLSILTESAELQAQTIQLSLSGIDNADIAEVFDNDYIGKPAYIWYATLDPTTYAVTGGETGPVLVFAGRMDYANIEFGDKATITVNVTSRLADWERSRGGRFNESYQRRHVDPTDNGFNYVRALQNKPVSWGGISIGDPGPGPPGNPGNNSGGGRYWNN